MSIQELILQEKKLFEDKQLIKPWLQSKLTLKGINIVIERSDESKIVFKCKCHHHQNREIDQYKQNRSNDIILERKRLRDLKKKFNCPFRIRANYSYRSKNWSLVVVNENHNHTLIPITSSPLSSNMTSPQPLSNYNYSRLPSLPAKEKTLNELQLEFNNSLLRLNCLNKEDEVRAIYMKLLKVLDQDNKTVLPSIHETFKYQDLKSVNENFLRY